MVSVEKIREYAATHVKSEPFCPFIAAYCDSRDYFKCDTCRLLEWYGDEVDDSISED